MDKRHLCAAMACQPRDSRLSEIGRCCDRRNRRGGHHRCAVADLAGDSRNGARSEEHTSELQSLMRTSYAVFCLKKTTTISNCYTHISTHKATTCNDLTHRTSETHTSSIQQIIPPH